MYVFFICSMLGCISEPDLTYESCNRLRYIFFETKGIVTMDCIPHEEWFETPIEERLQENGE